MAGSIPNISKLYNPDFPDTFHSRIVSLDVHYFHNSGLCRTYKDTKTVKNGCEVLGSQVTLLTNSLGQRNAAGAGWDT